MQGANVTVSAGMVCITVQYIQGHEAPPMSFVKLRSTSTQPTVTEMIGTSGCLEVATGTYHLSVTDADAMDTIDSEPAVTLDSILVPASPLHSPLISILPTGSQSNGPTGNQHSVSHLHTIHYYNGTATYHISLLSAVSSTSTGLYVAIQ